MSNEVSGMWESSLFRVDSSPCIRGGSRGWPALLGTRSDFRLLVLLLVFGCGPTSGDTVRFDRL